MSTRRVPLASLQNATNSPFRAAPAAAGGKRQRSHASEQRDLNYGQPPPKKQIIEVDDAEARRHGLVRRSGAQPTALTRKLEAARENKAPPAKHADKTQRASNDLDTIRQWQRHYRKLFPQFVFYFDSVSEPQKDKLMSRAQILGSVCVPLHPNAIVQLLTCCSVRLPSSPKMPPTSSRPAPSPPTLTPARRPTPRAPSILPSSRTRDPYSMPPSRSPAVGTSCTRPRNWE